MSTVISRRSLPFGLLELDMTGTVRNYAPVRGGAPTVTARQVIGKDFFSEVLPFEQARAYQRVFRYFMERGGLTRRMSFAVSYEGFTVNIQVMIASLGGRAEGIKRRMALVKIKPEGTGEAA
jgi:photoactive yellow protein